MNEKKDKQFNVRTKITNSIIKNLEEKGFDAFSKRRNGFYDISKPVFDVIVNELKKYSIKEGKDGK